MNFYVLVNCSFNTLKLFSFGREVLILILILQDYTRFRGTCVKGKMFESHKQLNNTPLKKKRKKKKKKGKKGKNVFEEKLFS